jgi:hypothetical protein
MSEYTIATMADFLALSPDQRRRCVQDMLLWADFVDAVRSEVPPVFATPDAMTWCDDDRPGEISEIRVCGVPV